MEKQDIYEILSNGCPHEVWDDSVCPNCAKEILNYLQAQDEGSDFTTPIFRMEPTPDASSR